MDVEKMKQDITSKIQNYFCKNNIQFDGNSFEDYIQEWMDICDKRIIAKKRKVIFSKELQNKIDNNLIDDETKRLIEFFKSKFENGENISPYLSKNIKNATSIDYLLTIWRIHHLHLIEELDGEMSKRSDKYILFVINQDNVYFLDQTKHLSGSEFASRYLLEILANNNWLHFVSIFESPEVISTNCEITSDEAMYKLWKSNINSCVFKIGNAFYTNINGLTMAGTSLQNQLHICNLNKALYSASQSNEMVYSRTELDSEILSLTIYCNRDGKEVKWITIEGD
ncbi:MAG: hypothetical protein IJQ07_04575 [Clostridia bacterium]|nr:hypothetical protein [Clostridia bacterium]